MMDGAVAAIRTSYQTHEWAGDAMDYKTEKSVRIAELCVDSNIARHDADLFAENMITIMDTHKIDILALAETAIGAEGGAASIIKQRMEQAGRLTWTASEHSHDYSKGTGTMLIMDKRLGKVTDLKTAHEGRALSVLLHMPHARSEEHKKLQIVVIYAPAGGVNAGPNSIPRNKLDKLIKWVEDNVKHGAIILGDMNAVRDTNIDRNRPTDQHPRNMVNTCIDTLKCLDAYRYRNPGSRHYTYIGGEARSRLDYVFVNHEMVTVEAAGILKEHICNSRHLMTMVDVLGIQMAMECAEAQEDKELEWRKLHKELKGCTKAEVVRMLKESIGRVSLVEKLIDRLNTCGRDEVEHHMADAVNRIHETMIKIQDQVRMKKPAPTEIRANLLTTLRMAAKEIKHKIVKEGRLRCIYSRSKELLEVADHKLHPPFKDVSVGVFVKNTLKAIHNDETETEQLGELRKWLYEAIKHLISNQGKDSKSAIKTFLDRRKAAAKAGDSEKFFRMLNNGPRDKGGYLPAEYETADGIRKIPDGKREIIDATVQEHGWINSSRWPESVEEPLRYEFYENTTDATGQSNYKLARDPVCKNVVHECISEAIKEIQGMRIPWEISGTMDDQISDSEWLEYIKKSKGKSPGKSGIKMGTIELIGGPLKDLTLAVVNAILRTRIIPKGCTTVMVVHIPKATGGTRPLGLIEEVVKVTSNVITTRQMRALSIMGMNTLVEHNQAYKPEKGCNDAVLLDVIKGGMASRSGEPWVRLEFDLDGWFDGIQHPLIQCTAEAAGMPESVYEYWNQLQAKARYAVVTVAGCTEPMKPSVGVTQGAQESPLKSLVCLWIWGIVIRFFTDFDRQKDLVGDMDDDVAYCTTHISYADDGCIYVPTSDVPPILGCIKVMSAALGISIKLKKTELQSWNNPEEGTTVVCTWNWRKDCMEHKEFPIKSANTAKWKTLGVWCTGKQVNSLQQEATAARMGYVLSKLAARGLATYELKPALQAGWVSLIGHCPLAFHITREMLAEMDKARNKFVRGVLCLAYGTPSEAFDAKAKVGGLELPSALANRLQDLTRELFVTLNSKSPTGQILREEWRQVFELGTESKEESLLAQHLKMLARFGIYIRDMKETTLSRMLDHAASNEKQVAVHDKNTKAAEEANARWSSLSDHAQRIKRGLDNRALRRFKEVADWLPFAAKRTDAEKYAAAYRNAIRDAAADRMHEAELNHCEKTLIAKIGRVEHRESTLLVDARLPPTQDEGACVYTDGAAGLHETGHGVGGATVWWNPDSGTRIAERHIWPSQYGSKNATAQMAEQHALLRAIPKCATQGVYTDSLITAHITQGSKVALDKVLQNGWPEKDGMCGHCKKAGSIWYMMCLDRGTCFECMNNLYGSEDYARMLSRKHNYTLVARIWDVKIARRNELIWENPCGDYRDEKHNTGFSATQTMRCRIGGQDIIKIRAHQDERHDEEVKNLIKDGVRIEDLPKFEPQPDERRFKGNQIADAEAGEAAKAASERGTSMVKYPHTNLRFVIVRKGLVTMEKPNTCVKTWHREDTTCEWINTKRLTTMAMAARAANAAEPGTMEVECFEEVRIPDPMRGEFESNRLIDISRIAFKIRLGSGGSTTQLTYLNNTVGRYAKLGDAEEESDPPEKKCILCGAESGNMAHMFYECTHEGIATIRRKTLEYINEMLGRVSTPEKLSKSLKEEFPEAEDWRVVDAKQNLPNLNALKWLVLTNKIRSKLGDKARWGVMELGHHAIIPKVVLDCAEAPNRAELATHLARTLMVGVMQMRTHARAATLEIAETARRGPRSGIMDAASGAPVREEDLVRCKGGWCEEMRQIYPKHTKMIKAADRAGCQNCKKHRARNGMKEVLDMYFGYSSRPESRFQAFYNNGEGVELKEWLETLNKDYGTSRNTAALEEALKSRGFTYTKDGRAVTPLRGEQITKICGCANAHSVSTDLAPCNECMGQKGRFQEVQDELCEKCEQRQPEHVCGGCGAGFHAICLDSNGTGTGTYLCNLCYNQYANAFGRLNDTVPGGKWTGITSANDLNGMTSREYPNENKEQPVSTGEHGRIKKLIDNAGGKARLIRKRIWSDDGQKRKLAEVLHECKDIRIKEKVKVVKLLLWEESSPPQKGKRRRVEVH